jgi:hypothetical protein
LLSSFVGGFGDDTHHYIGGAPSTQTSLDLPHNLARNQTHRMSPLAATIGLKQQHGIDTVVLLNWMDSK